MTYNKHTEIVFGHEGEKGFREVRFDVSELPEGVIYLEHLRHGDKYAYPISLDRMGDEAVWIPNETDTAKEGTGKGQLVCYVGDEVVYKSDVFKAINRYSLSTTDEVPDGYDSWIASLETLGADIIRNTEMALFDIEADRIKAVNKVESEGSKAVNEVVSAKTSGLNAVNEAKDSALDRISAVSADGIEAINTAKTQGVNAVNEAKDSAHRELDGYVAEHRAELTPKKGVDYFDGEKGEKGDAYIVTDEDLKEIGDRVEAEYEPNLNALKEEVSHKAEATDLATANRKIKALTDVLNGKELAFETNEYEGNVEVPSGAVADSILKIGGHSKVSKNYLPLDDWALEKDGKLTVDKQTGTLTVTSKQSYSGARFVLDVSKMQGKTIVLKCDSFTTEDYTISTVRIRIVRSSGTSYATITPARLTSNAITVDSNITSLLVEARGNNTASEFASDNTVTVTGLMLVDSTNSDIPYEPYFEGIKSSQTDAVEVYKADKTLDKQIPTDLPILRSAGSVHDSIEGGKLIRRVGAVDLGTLRWVANGTYATGKYQFFAIVNDKAFGKLNLLCPKYETSIRGGDSVILGRDITNGVSVNDPIAKSVTELAESLNGVMLYYELAKPIVTDIDPIPDLEAINVEASGEISFIDHSDMDFPIPSTHEWVVRNEEV